MTYNDKLLQDVEDYVRRYERHLPVDIVDKITKVIAAARQYRVRVIELESMYESRHPDGLHDRERPTPPQKLVQGSWVDA
jgi:hypothetical protein